MIRFGYSEYFCYEIMKSDLKYLYRSFVYLVCASVCLCVCVCVRGCLPLKGSCVKQQTHWWDPARPRGLEAGTVQSVATFLSSLFFLSSLVVSLTSSPVRAVATNPWRSSRHSLNFIPPIQCHFSVLLLTPNSSFDSWVQEMNAIHIVPAQFHWKEINPN